MPREATMTVTGRQWAVFFAALFVSASASRGDLTINVTQGANNLGQIRLHVGTSDFTATGNEGLGKATAAGEQSGYYTPDGKTLADMAKLSGEDHFNWLQIVKVQPAGQNDTFGAVPHADPSDTPKNPQKRDNQPWYLNEGATGRTPNPPINPPFDLPALTANLLPFQDFPSGGFKLNESIQFDTYLVSIVSQAKKTYDVLAGFTWTDTFEKVGDDDAARMHVTNLKAITAILPKDYEKVVTAYGGMGWRLVPEPSSLSLLGGGLVMGLGYSWSRRRRAAA
jgi:hypothetical protein